MSMIHANTLIIDMLALEQAAQAECLPMSNQTDSRPRCRHAEGESSSKGRRSIAEREGYSCLSSGQEGASVPGLVSTSEQTAGTHVSRRRSFILVRTKSRIRCTTVPEHFQCVQTMPDS